MSTSSISSVQKLHVKPMSAKEVKAQQRREKIEGDIKGALLKRLAVVKAEKAVLPDHDGWTTADCYRHSENIRKSPMLAHCSTSRLENGFLMAERLPDIKRLKAPTDDYNTLCIWDDRSVPLAKLEYAYDYDSRIAKGYYIDHYQDATVSPMVAAVRHPKRDAYGSRLVWYPAVMTSYGWGEVYFDRGYSSKLDACCYAEKIAEERGEHWFEDEIEEIEEI